jgi:cell division protein FtsI/penicillin-binding protein 2
MSLFPSIGSKKDTRTVGRGFQSIFLIVFTLLMTSGIEARLAYLQIVEGTKLRERGEWGGQQVEVDGVGRPIRVVGEKQAKAGKDLHLTIDLDVQKAAEKALGNHRGAIAAIDPNKRYVGCVSDSVTHQSLKNGALRLQILRFFRNQI